MPCLKTLRAALALSAQPLAATGQQPGTPGEIVDKQKFSYFANIHRSWKPIFNIFVWINSCG
jgi:hypothetical protein